MGKLRKNNRVGYSRLQHSMLYFCFVGFLFLIRLLHFNRVPIPLIVFIVLLVGYFQGNEIKTHS